MKTSFISVMLASVLFAAAANAKLEHHHEKEFLGADLKDLKINNVKINKESLQWIESHPVLASHRLQFISKGKSTGSQPEAITPAIWETPLPHESQPKISPLERAILIAYLEDPTDVRLALALAIKHLQHSLLNPRPHGGEAVKNSILAQYFLNRVEDLGHSEKWISLTKNALDKKLTQLIDQSQLDTSYGTASHRYFIDAFNYNEKNRYQAVKKLLDDFAKNPNNAFTNAYLTASNIWVGGEAGYEDPTVLYSFVLSSFFSVRTVALAEQMEVNWFADPVANQRFRLAPILGGWTVPARRWLAKLHDDQDAIALLDEEHRKWLTINRAFHSASIGLMMFEEPENFAEGIAAWNAGFEHCQEVPEVRSCLDRPRFSHNNLSFLLGGIDYFIKAGLLDMAQMFLSLRYFPDFAYETWTLGHDAWEHRENNLQERYQRYQNNDPSDDPVHFLLKTRKWGPSTITCQTCHQVQGKTWSPEEIGTILPPHESIATIGTWPEISTTWYGSIK